MWLFSAVIGITIHPFTSELWNVYDETDRRPLSICLMIYGVHIMDYMSTDHSNVYVRWGLCSLLTAQSIHIQH